MKGACVENAGVLREHPPFFLNFVNNTHRSTNNLERVVQLVVPALSTHPLWSWAASLAASFLEPNVAASPNQSLVMGLEWLLAWNGC